jgi:diguanylate cyclase (GGDEF)-like protein/PAS domain S-box-containing protein
VVTPSDMMMTPTYDVRLVVLSIVIASIASYTALAMAGRITVAKGQARLWWLTGGAIAMGLGIWSMHFIAMLACKLPIPLTYDIPIVVASMVVSVIASGAALFIASRQSMGFPALLGGGVFMGLGIASMHYTGMVAMRLNAVAHYNPLLVGISIAIAISASAIALWLTYRMRSETHMSGILHKIGAAVIMGNAIPGMHYTAMAAVAFQKTSKASTKALPGIDNSLVAIGIGLATIIILTIALIASIVEQRLRVQMAAAEAIRKSEQRYRALARNASDIIAILGTNGVVSYVSLSITRILGYEPQDWFGTTAFEFIHPDDFALAERLLADTVQNSAANITAVLRLKNAAGEWQDFEVVFNNLLDEPSVAGIVTTYRNITERKQTALALRNRLQQQASVAQLGQQALASTDVDTLMDTAANMIVQILCVEYSEVLELLPEGKELRLRAGVGWHPGVVGEYIVSAYPDSQAGYTLLSKKPVIVEDLRTEIRFVAPGVLQNHRVVSSINVIIPGKNSPYGVLAAHTTQRRTFSPDDIYFLESVANVLSTAIERHNSEMLLQRYRLLSEHTQDIMLFTRMNGEIIEANSAALNAYRYKASEFSRLTIKDLRAAPKHCLIPTERERADSIGLVYETLHRRSDGSTFPVEISSRGIRLGSDRLTLSIIRDITERKRYESALFREKELAQVTLQSIKDAVVTTDAFGRIKSLNPVAEKLTGWSQAEAENKALKEVVHIVNESTSEPIENPVEKLLRGQEDEAFAKNTVLIARDRSQFAIAHSAAPIRSHEGEIVGMVLVFRDVTESRRMARQLSWQASHDPLTGLVNRREFEQRLEQALESAQEQKQEHALCYLDLDKFKIVNDTCGHAAGDELLLQVTHILKSHVRKSDTVARLGGDEFAVLLLNCSLAQAKAIADACRQEIQDFRFHCQDKDFSIGVSIGLVAVKSDAPSLSRVLSLADAACYAAKSQGRNRVCVA